MSDQPYGFSQAKARLEDIVSQVRKKDTSLETSLDLLEEGVRLANQCTELIDHADWEAAVGDSAPEGETDGGQETSGDDASVEMSDSNEEPEGVGSETESAQAVSEDDTEVEG